MTRERFDQTAEPVPRMSGAARADVEALRASERLQRIFQGDMARGRGRSGPRGPQAMPLLAAEPRREVAKAAAPGAWAWFSSNRTRVLVGLVPVYLATAVLAVEGVKALREEPERVAFVSAGPASAPPEAGPSGGAPAVPAAGKEVEPAPAVDAGTVTGGEPLDGERLASLPAGPERSAIPMPRPAERAAAQREAAPRGAKASGDLAKTIGSGQADMRRAARSPVDTLPAEAGPTETVASGSPPARAGAATELAERRVRSAAAGPDAAPAGREEPEALGSPAAGAAAPPDRRAEAGTMAGTAPAEPVPGAAERAGQPAAGAVELPAEGSETVPQATWTPGEAAPAPVPVPRFARLSEVLSHRGAARAAADEPTSQGALEPSALQRRADAAAPGPSAGSALPGSTQRSGSESGSAPPRIVVHYPRGAGPAAAQQVASELLERGYARTELRPVSFPISRANVRFYHRQNQTVARTVNELVEATGRRSDLRDFTSYAPLPSVGTVEVWLPG